MNKYLVFYNYTGRGQLDPQFGKLIMESNAFPTEEQIMKKAFDRNNKVLSCRITGITNITNENAEYWETILS